MAQIKAFPALRYTEKAGDICKNVCPPYDIISEEERKALLLASENNIVRLELPRGDEPYKEAGATLCSMLEKGILKTDDKNGLYIYEEEFSAIGAVHKIKGIYSRVRLTDFSEGVVLPHEETLSKAKQDRFNLMSSTYCNFSAIYSMYTDEERCIRNKIDSLSERKPDIEFAADDGVIQRLWCIYDEAEIAFIEKAFLDKKLYIADGHHRYETALNFKKKLLDEGKISDENDAANYCMMFLCDIDHEGLVVFPTHRLVKDLENFNSQEALSKMEEFFTIEKKACKNCLKKALAENTDKTVFGYYDGDGAYLLTLKDNEHTQSVIFDMMKERSQAYRELDVSILHSLILERIFGIDKENMANQINLNYTRDYDEAIDVVNSGKYNCSFVINATKVRQIKDVATAGDKMPQKSTYFYPKLITGLVMNKFYED